MAKRVFELARELGVKSKDVLDKCRDEGVPGMDNHMSSVSAGLEASIRSWFTDGGAAVEETEENGSMTATSTATATAEPRAERAEKPRAARRKVAKRKDAASLKAAPERPLTPRAASRAAAARAEQVVAEEERRIAEESRPTPTPTPTPTRAPAPAATTTEAAATRAPQQVEPSRAAAAAEAEPQAAAAETTEAIPAAEQQVGAPPSPPIEEQRLRAMPNVPQRPETVTPVGPNVEQVQKVARVTGPQVVRVEEPEHVEAPRSRARRETLVPGGRGAGAAQPTPAGPSTRGGPSRRNTRRKTSGRETRSGQSGRFGGAGGGAKPRDWNQQDLLEREQRLRGAHGFIKTIRRDATKRQQGGGERAKTAREVGGSVKIQEPITIKDLSAATGVRAADIIKTLFTQKSMMTTINAGLDSELAQEIMLEWGIELQVEEQRTAQDVVTDSFSQREMIDERSRPPVVTILGHVDHGKTSLLDRIRKANVAAGEAGGITQHTSSFRVNVRTGDDEKLVVFLDTPGHEAFTSMRARGARITDIVVLVVAADDGVMPQTVESINHAKAAGVPIVVALNKIDKPEATDSNIQRIYGQLAEYDLSPTAWGGSTELVKVSAVTGDGIQDLLDVIDYQAQLMDLKADHAGAARGTVIEASMEEGRGPVANVLIQDGQIKVGDFIVVGRAYGRVRSMIDDRNKQTNIAGPATPLEISGLSAVPDAGDTLYVVETLRMAEQAAESRLQVERERQLATPKVTLDSIFSQIKERARKDLNLVVKADVQGSVETLRKTLEDISTDELNIRVLHAGVGGVSKSDVLLAEASGAIIIGFHVIASAEARELAEQKHVEMRTYQIIYELLDDVKKAAEGLLEPELREEVLGHASVRQVFKVSRVGWIAGCYVTDGTIERNAKIRVTRQDIVVENNRVLEQLKRFKDDAREVRAGQECGMKIEGYDDIKEGDILECYRTISVKRSL